MDYYNTKIQITPFAQWLSDSIASQLCEIGYESFVQTGNGLEAYIPVDCFKEGLLTSLIKNQSQKIKITWENDLIKSRNWNEEWEKNYFQPLVINRQCLIRAPFHSEYPECKYEIVIEPNMAFGTGNHETTTMMTELLLDENLSGKIVLDMGCGTGILSILSSMLGAAEITAIDINEYAYEAAKTNSRLNRIKNITPMKGDASLLGKQKFDYILANIQRNVLLNDMEKYIQVLNPGGKLLMSGFYNYDTAPIKGKAVSLGLTADRYSEENNWVAYSFLK